MDTNAHMVDTLPTRKFWTKKITPPSFLTLQRPFGAVIKV